MTGKLINLFAITLGVLSWTATGLASEATPKATNIESRDNRCNISADWQSGDCILTSNTDRYTFVVNYPKGHTCMVKFATDANGMNNLADKVDFYLGFDFSEQGGEEVEHLPLLATKKTMLGGTGSEFYYMAFYTIRTKSGASLNDVIRENVIGQNVTSQSGKLPTIQISGVDCQSK